MYDPHGVRGRLCPLADLGSGTHEKRESFRGRDRDTPRATGEGEIPNAQDRTGSTPD